MRIAAVIDHITGWLNSYVERSGTKGFVIGVSGGIDSAVTSTLGARTGKPLLCVEMPIHQTQNQVSRAFRHIEFLKANYPNAGSVEVPLTDVFDGLIRVLPPVETQWQDIALVNTRARLRMTTLYYFAAFHSYLVLGTGNKVEDFGIGFFNSTLWTLMLMSSFSSDVPLHMFYSLNLC